MTTTLFGWFVGSARRYPDAPALELGRQVVTYRRLDSASANVAARLAGTGVTDGVRVGLLASRTPTAYAGYLAVLRLGAVVVPLNPHYPAGRNVDLAERAGITTLLVDADRLSAADSELIRGRLAVPMTDADFDADPVTPPLETTGDLAYLLFTSGSTGRPKGVPIRHGNLDPFLRYNIARYAIGPGARLSQMFELTFDGSVLDLFLAWGAGATVVVPTRGELLDPVGFVADRNITHWCSAASAIALARADGTLSPDRMPHLKWSLFSAEPLPVEWAAAWARAAPASTIENLYGPTELTVTVSGYRLPRDRMAWPVPANRTVPIGTVYPHLSRLVLDDDARPAFAGELCVRGPQRFDGYLDAADNAGRFLRTDGGSVCPVAPEDVRPTDWFRTGDLVSVEGGLLVHQGRRDRQVKVRGYRVEPQEVEAGLRTEPGVMEAAVFVTGTDEGLSVLAAAVTGPGLSPAGLVAALRRRLPRHLVPDRIIVLDRLPRTLNGKVDHDALERRCRAEEAGDGR